MPKNSDVVWLSIKWKLMAMITVVAVGLVIILTSIQISTQREVLKDELDQRIALMKANLIERSKVSTKNLAQQVENDLAAFNFSGMTESIQGQVENHDDLKYAIVMDQSMMVYVHTLQPDLVQTVFENSRSRSALDFDDLQVIEYQEEGKLEIEVVAPIQISTQPWGVLRLIYTLEELDQEVALSRQQIQEKIQQMINDSVITALVFMVISSLIVFFLSTRLTIPLIQLTELSRQLSQGDFSVSQSIPKYSQDELGVLARTFVKMSQNLKDSYEKLEDYSHTLEQKVDDRTEELRLLSEKLAKYLSPQVYKSIFSGEKDVKRETYRKMLTVFFSDIVNFTGMTDSMESETMTFLLNSYLNEMAQIALRYGGTIDKFIGDSVMIFFGDPQTKGKKEDAVACVLMAVEMRECLVHLRKMWVDEGIPTPLHVRMGINTGYCTVGNFGSDDRLDYTIIGSQVNLASRLETNAKAGQILVSHETYSLVKDFVVCEKSTVLQVKGIAYPVQTYEVKDLQRNLSTVADELEEEFDGFSMSMDFGRIADVERAQDILRIALERLKKR